MLFALAIIMVSCNQVKPTSFSSNNELSVAFYNVENLFDTKDDPNTNDEEFTPSGKKAWTAERYAVKLENLGKVVQAMDSNMPDIIGLCEIENREVVEDFNNSTYLKAAGYEILHRESPDGRGIDVGLMYNPSKVKLEIEGVIETVLPAGTRPNTRLIIHAAGVLNGKSLNLFVNHWPSRGGGKNETEPNRLSVARNLKLYVQELLAKDPQAMIIFMGDFNDHPNDKSLAEVLNAGIKEKNTYNNLMWDMHKNGLGSYNYRGTWGALDQFIVSKNLTDGAGIDVDQSSVKFVKEDWMMYTNKKGETYPSRTYGGPNYYGGCSDHLPIFMKLKW